MPSGHVKSGGDGELGHEMESLERVVGRGVEPRSDANHIVIGLPSHLMPRTEDRECLRDQADTRISFAIALVKPLLPDYAPLVEDEGAWIRQVHVTRPRRNAVDGVILLDPL
jgi:hypothetical protein